MFAKQPLSKPVTYLNAGKKKKKVFSLVYGTILQ